MSSTIYTVKFIFSRSRIVLNRFRFVRLRIFKETIGFSKFLGTVLNNSEKVIMSMKNNGTVNFSDAVSQCGDYLTVDEENILVLRKTTSPVPEHHIEFAENLEVSDT